MPGIVTHSRVFRESIASLSKREKKSYLHRSLETLFHTPENLRAGLFGSIGADIFNYLPNRKKNGGVSDDISFFLHDGGVHKLLNAMIATVVSYADNNNEWAAAQRSYLYGFISHFITDATFNPYIFYYSGFPGTTARKEINFYREQNLLFEYNIDNYLQYHEERSKEFPFLLEEMIPLQQRYRMRRLDDSVKELLLDSIKKAYPDIYQRLAILPLKKNDHDTSPPATFLDMLPYSIMLAYRIKRTNNARFADFLRYLRRNNVFYSDHIIRYPSNKRYNKNILNMHRERWEHPAGKIGLHYESVHNLLTLSCDRTIEFWEKIESSMFTGEKPNLNDYLCINAYTGDAKLKYKDLRIKNPIRLTN